MMRLKSLVILLAAGLCWTCQTEFPIDVPNPIPDLPAGSVPIPDAVKPLMEGVYTITNSNQRFGSDAALKWAGTHMTLFTRSSYLTFETGTRDSIIYFRGYWRVPTSDDYGLIDLMIAKEDGAASLLKGVMPATLIIKGVYGGGNQTAATPITLQYERYFSSKVTGKKFRIVGHRGGGRTSDRLEISENSVEMIKYAGRLGATGIEIDVRLTKDGVPILYHDGDINIRLTQKSPLNGPIENFTWDQLEAFVWLIRGEKIPTLEQALEAAIDHTQLDFVWLDIKDPNVVAAIRYIQQDALDYAASKGRDIEILMGVPADDVLEALKAQSNYTSIPSLCEISPEEARALNSRAWGPRWTLGTQNDLVASVQAEGRIAICWTIDVPAYINQYITQGRFDGLLTNYPSYVAYYHYIQP
ncbi:MAG: glycerophosphodiester phosphodiesterase family protein [Cyclobacteriaceae bacterium]|nr:glycerophosphodiester phosphodiesterase family protein [Cyclobacteriaceae bacterium]